MKKATLRSPFMQKQLTKVGWEGCITATLPPKNRTCEFPPHPAQAFINAYSRLASALSPSILAWYCR